MSTNIRVDVTLQRLQNQSRQATEQNRTEKAEREERVIYTTIQPQKREEIIYTTNQPQKREVIYVETRANTRTIVTQTVSGQDFADVKFVPAGSVKRDSPFDKRRPAAQRLEEGSTMGVQYTTQVIAGSPQPTFRLTVGPPGQLQYVQADTLAPSTAAATNRPATTSTTSGAESVLGFLILHDPPNFFGNDWTTEYPCGSSFQTGKGTAPTSSWTESTTARVITQDFTDSAGYLLPIGSQTCIFLYVYSKLRTLTVYERKDRTDRTSVNPRFTTSGCGLQTGTYYDRESTFRVEDIFDNIEQRQSYQIMAFLVAPDSVRALEVPEQLDAAIRQLHPPMEVNSTAEMLTSSEYTRYEFAEVAGVTDEPQNYNGPVTYGYSTIPIFSSAVHRQGSLHGNYQSVSTRNDVLAKQFGMGYLHQDTHDGNFFTPAVFRFIRSAMDLSTSNAQLYDYMRSTYFSRAPKRYLAPCVIESSCTEQETVGFDQTTTAPVNIDTPVQESDFSRKAKYDVALNGAFDYEVVFGWDWDDPTYCAQQLKALGFTTADLKP